MPLKLSQEELEEAEDELIRLMHDRFLSGEDIGWINYELIDQDENLDDTD